MGSSASKILSFSSQYLLHNELLYVVLLICDVGEPILGPLFWGVIIADRSHLFVIIVNFCLAIMARARAWLPLALLMWSLLFMGAIVSDVSCFVATETDHFPNIVLGPFWIGHCLSPPISSR